MISALQLDALNLLVWQNSKDGQKGRNKPKSILEESTKKLRKQNSDTFNSIAEFEAFRKRFVKDGN